MKLYTSNGKKTIKLSKIEWENIGKKAKWIFASNKAGQEILPYCSEIFSLVKALLEKEEYYQARLAANEYAKLIRSLIHDGDITKEDITPEVYDQKTINIAIDPNKSSPIDKRLAKAYRMIEKIRYKHSEEREMDEMEMVSEEPEFDMPPETTETFGDVDKENS